MASVYSLDEHGTEVSSLKWTQDLTNISDMLDVCFTCRERLDFSDLNLLTWNDFDWRVVSSRWIFDGSMWQCSALAVPPATASWVSFDYKESSDLFSQLDLEVVVGKSHKFPLCIKGDTLAVVLRKQNLLSMEVNAPSDIRSSYCDYVGYNGAYVNRWSDMEDDVTQFTSGLMAFDVKIDFLDSHDLYRIQHTPLGSPWNMSTYFQYLFKDRLEVKSGLLGELGRGYNLSSFGYDTEEVYILVKQEYNPRSEGLPFNQVFVTLR